MALRLRHFASLLMTGAALAAGVMRAQAATPITFDTYPNGTAISNQYQSQGVLFSSFTSPATIFADAAEATSSPNILVGVAGSTFRDIDITMVDPATGLPSASHRACLVSLNVISVGWTTVTLTSYDGAGAPLQSFVLNRPTGPVNGFGNVDHLDFTTGGIAKVSMNFSNINFGDGIGIDDVLVDFECTTPAARSTWGHIKQLYQ
ncbi:MAG: hypothetical protein IT500_15600 [Rubrivivax sp.]|nr:hypothetical protein [Rubrivivax sp.]